jgi:aminoglycoside 6'-N-acetyltransferase
MELILRPLAPEDAPELRRIHATPEVERWWGAAPDGFPLSDDDPGTTRLTFAVDGAVAGMIQFSEEPERRASGCCGATSAVPTATGATAY